MIKKLVLTLLASAVVASAQAASGIWGGYVVLEINGGGNQFYKLENPDDNFTPSFNGTNLGTFDPNVNELFLRGGEALTFKNDGSDVTGAILQWRIFQSGFPEGSFSGIGLPFAENLGDGGDQKWQHQNANINLLAGLAPGTYTLQVYVQAESSDGTHFLNAGGSNYSATFTVVPEPSSLSLLAGPALLGAWFYVRRRRAS
jgi:hypothetical protein